MVFLALLFASLCVSWDPRDVFIEEKIDPSKLKDEVEEMVHHAFDSYRNCESFFFFFFFFFLLFLLILLCRCWV